MKLLKEIRYSVQPVSLMEIWLKVSILKINNYITETLVTHKSSNMCKIVIRENIYKNLINIIFCNTRSNLVPSSIG